MKRISYLLVLVTLYLAGCGNSGAIPASPGAAANPPAKNSARPDSATTTTAEQIAPATPPGVVRLAIVDYDGIMQKIAGQKGKVVVVDAWSTSCPPCMKEFHNLVELHQKYGPEQVACISLSFDYEGLGTPEEQQGRVLKFLRGQGAAFENLLSNEESDTLYRKFKLAAVPAVFVYDRAGQLRKRFDNEQSKSAETAFTYGQVGQLVADLLNESPGDQGSPSDDANTSGNQP